MSMAINLRHLMMTSGVGKYVLFIATTVIIINNVLGAYPPKTAEGSMQ